MPSKIDCFELGKVIGRGPHGVVYAGRNSYTGEYVAVKLLDGEVPDDEQRRSQLHVTIQRLLALSHANVLPLRRILLTEGRCYLVARRIPLQPLNQYWPDKIETPQALFAVLGPALQAIRHAHSLRLCHGHLSPSNFGWSEDKVLLVSDFAVASLFGHLKHPESFRSLAPQMAPEIIRGAAPAVQADVYSLASLLYFLLTRELPPREQDLLKDVPQKEQQDEEETRFSFLEIQKETSLKSPPAEKSETFPLQEPFRSAITWALADRPEERPASLDQFLTAMRDGVKNEIKPKTVSLGGKIRFCAQCGRAVPEQQQICLGCGHPVEEVSKTAPPEPTDARKGSRTYFHEMGDWLLLNKRTEEAITAYQRAVRTEQTVELYSDLGNALSVGQSWPQAEEAYRQALVLLEQELQKRPGEYGQLRYALAQVLIARNRYTEAAELLNHVIADREVSTLHTQAKMSLAATYTFQRQYGKAEQLLNEIIAQYPEQGAPHFCLGNVYVEMGDTMRATLEFEKVLALQPDHAGAAEALVNLQRRQYQRDDTGLDDTLPDLLLGGGWSPWILASQLNDSGDRRLNR